MTVDFDGYACGFLYHLQDAVNEKGKGKDVFIHEWTSFFMIQGNGPSDDEVVFDDGDRNIPEPYESIIEVSPEYLSEKTL